MAWKKLDIDDLKKILSQDEIDTLSNVSTEDTRTTNIVNEAIDLVADMFRGALQAKGYAIDIREHYSPPEYALRILQEARVIAWSRFPNSPVIAIDEVRKEQAKQLEELLKNPYIAPSKPEAGYSSDDPVNGGSNGIAGISLPFLRFDESLYTWNKVFK